VAGFDLLIEQPTIAGDRIVDLRRIYMFGIRR
jgi:hypothetical protein